MATTKENQILEAFRLNNFSKLSSVISSMLAEYIFSRNILSLDEFAQNPIVDLSLHKNKITGFTSIQGIELFASLIEQLIFPNTSTTALQSDVLNSLVGKINLSNFTKLKKIVNPSGGTQIFTGDLSKLTSLQWLELTADSYGNTLKLPVLSANPNLTYLYYNGTGFAGSSVNLTKDNTGKLATNLLLETFKLTYLNTANIANSREVIDSVLETLKTAKQAGGAIKVIDFTGSPAPTLGANDPNYIWLANLLTPQKVTLGVL